MSIMILEQAASTVTVEPAVAEQAVTPEPVLIAATVLARIRNGEMPMFMNAYEIMSGFQPLDADREALFSEPDACECGAVYDDTMECDCCFSDEFCYEDDDALWERKYEEISWSDNAEDIIANGVRNPISLQWDQDCTGDSGRPEVLGGHHRVALMEQESPFALMPVAFFNSPTTARKSLGGSY